MGLSAQCSWAERLGEILADAGYAVVCGGGGGVMEAVCRGAAGRGGHTIGVLPGEDPEEANPWVSTAIVTGMGTSRNRIIALSGSAAVAVGGSYGTLSEIAFNGKTPGCGVTRELPPPMMGGLIALCPITAMELY